MHESVLAASLWVVVALLAAPPGVAPSCRDVTLTATIDPDLATIRGRMRCVVARDGALAVATYPRVLGNPASVGAIERPWVYPSGASVADLRLAEEGRARDGEGAWQELGDRHAGTTVALDFETLVPERNGLFGRRDHAVYLLGGWHPAFGVAETPLVAVPIDYEITVPPGMVGFVGSSPVGRTSPRRQRGRFVGRFVPIALGREASVDVTPHGVVIALDAGLPDESGARAWSVEDDRRERAPRVRDVSAYRDRELRTEIAATLAAGTAFAQSVHVPVRPLIALVAPLREHMVEAFDGGLAVADRAFALPPLDGLAWLGVPRDLLARFPRQAIWRAELAFFVAPLAAAREHRVPPELIADAVAVDLRDALVATRYGGAAFAPDYLEPIAVIPEIDALLYAPQAPFADAYFDAIDERRATRDGVDDFTEDLPRGKLIYEKLVDELGPAAAHALTLAYLTESRPYLDLVAATAPDVAARLGQWLGAAPRRNYAVHELAGDPTRITIDVHASGPDAERIPEPLSVVVRDAAGDEHRATRLGPGLLEFAAPGPARLVELDPRHRTVELWHPPGEDARFDNRVPPRWRLLLNNLSGLVAVTNRQVAVAADFGLHRIYDLRHDFDLRLAASPEAFGVSAGAAYGFGHEVTPLRLAERVGVGLGGMRLLSGRGSPTPGFEGDASVYYLYDSRPSLVTSYSGQGLAARLSASLGADATGRDYRFVQASLSAFRLLPLSFYNALLVRARFDRTFGAAPLQALHRLGGRYTAGRGFETDEERADRRGVVSLEYRHAWSVDTRTDFGGLFVLTGVEGALFGDAVYLPVHRPGCDQDTFLDAGYGVRFLVDLLNVSPSSLALDVGVPLYACRDRARAPVSIYLAFVQSFLLF